MGINGLACIGALVVAAPLLAGCSRSQVLPSAPSGGTPSTLDVPQAANPSRAVVAIEDPFAVAYRNGNNYSYIVRFLLREAGGASGATIDQVDVYGGPFGSEGYGASCWGTLRIPAGGELDTFYTDAGSEWLSYCAPGTGRDRNVGVSSLHIIVSFTDDSGVAGSVGSPITAIR